MIDSLVGLTSLPNLHPAVVHFPIALFPLALAFEAAGLVLRKRRWLVSAATAVYVVAALGAWLAVWAGERAADGLLAVPAAVQPHIAQHSDWAHYALYSMAALALLRLAVHLRPSLAEHRGARAAVLVLGVVTLGVLGRVADLGGALVFRHGMAVQARTAQPDAGEEREVADVDAGSEASAADRLERREDGGLVWRPLAGDREALGTVLTAVPGFGLDGVRWVDSGAELGLTIDVLGPTILVLPGTFADVQVEARVELVDYEGSVGVVHHQVEHGDGGYFALSTDGSATLADVRDGSETVLDQSRLELPGGTFELAVSAAGRHLKGLLDGKTIAHGHVARPPSGQCGLRLDGRGTLRVVQVTVLPLAGS